MPTAARSRRFWFTGSVVVLLAMLAPVALDRDSFPLSTYPMYSRARPSDVTFATAVGLDGEGSVQRLSLPIIGASDDPLIVAGELRTAIARGRAAARCEEIAGRVGGAGSAASGGELTHVEVVIERHDVVDQVTGDASLLERTVHARCRVGEAT